MFERFTVKAIKVIMLAQGEARRLGHNFVGTEQVLIGLINEGTGIAAKCLKSAGVNLKDARIEVEKIIGRGSGFVAVEIPFTPRSKRALELSWDEARQLGHNYIDTEHLLLGILRAGEGVAARVLENLGVDLGALRSRVLESVAEGKGIEPNNPKVAAIDKPISYNLGIASTDSFAKVTETTNSSLKFLMDILSPAARNLASELEEVVRSKELALREQEFEKAALLLGKQIEISEKLRRLSEQGNV